MKNWREQPHLFANKKFKIKVPEFSNPVTFNAYWFNDLKNELDRATLISRPISDMSDKEKKKNNDLLYLYESHNYWWQEYESLESFLYLISIGVLPEMFDTTDVIWRYENE